MLSFFTFTCYLFSADIQTQNALRELYTQNLITLEALPQEKLYFRFQEFSSENIPYDGNNQTWEKCADTIREIMKPNCPERIIVAESLSLNIPNLEMMMLKHCYGQSQ